MSQTDFISIDILQLFITTKKLQTKGSSIVKIVANSLEHRPEQDKKVFLRIKVDSTFLLYTFY